MRRVELQEPCELNTGLSQVLAHIGRRYRYDTSSLGYPESLVPVNGTILPKRQISIRQFPQGYERTFTRSGTLQANQSISTIATGCIGCLHVIGRDVQALSIDQHKIAALRDSASEARSQARRIALSLRLGSDILW